MYQLVLILHVVIALSIITLVLIQHGKGADIGASFGSGASGTVFGSQGSGGFLFKLTAVLAIVFFVTSVFLSFLLSMQYQKADALTQLKQVPSSKVQKEIPVPLDEDVN